MKQLRILGTRGIPAEHGGFETFAQHLALFLVKQGWQVAVYCQRSGRGETVEDSWNGVKRVHIPVASKGAKATVIFDLKSILHAVREPDLVLTLGYNTATFCTLFRIKGIQNIINMDGIEWKREKWNLLQRFWLYANDWLGCLLGNHLIADHPEIAKHLSSRVSNSKISVIPYGADRIDSADSALLERYNLKANNYCLVIARPEPENSIFEIVQAFSHKRRNHKLVVLGTFKPRLDTYHKKVYEVASEEVIFPGAIYQAEVVEALRFFCSIYIHGHTVGGTNPSLVEALGAATPVLAHENKFNRWVAADAGLYFKSEAEIADLLDKLLLNDELLKELSNKSRKRHAEAFLWEDILSQYEKLLERWC